MNEDIKKSLRDLVTFSLPIIFGQLSQMLIGVGDTFVAGRYQTEAVAAIGIANGILNPFFLFGIGMINGISPKVSHWISKNIPVQNYFIPMGIFVTVISVAIILMCLGLNYFVPLFDFEQALVPLIQDYIIIVSISYLPIFLFIAFKEYLQAFEDVWWVNILSLLSVGVNILFNYLFIYGFDFGLFNFPSLGAIGTAYASLSIRIFLLISVFLPFLFRYKVFPIVSGESELESKMFVKELFHFSLPVAFSYFVEVMAFSLVAVLAGSLGVISAATNNIVLNITGTAFMLPLSISSALGVKIAHYFGKEDWEQVRNYTKAGLLISLGLTIVTSGLFFLLPETFMSLFSTDTDVIELGVKVLLIVALFQLFDGAQITLAGILRGLQQSNTPFIALLLCYWLFGLPIGGVLVYQFDMGVQGLWIGLALSLMLVSIILGYLVTKRLKK